MSTDALLFEPDADPSRSHGVSETQHGPRAKRCAERHRDHRRTVEAVSSWCTAASCAPGCLCINFSTYKNFDEDIDGKAGAFIPRVGPMTVLMVIRNALRLHRNARSDG